jgi:hypothetical protein
MFICIVILIAFLPAAVLPLALQSFSPDELMDRGICFENPQSPETQADPPARPANTMHNCQSCLSSGVPA